MKTFTIDRSTWRCGGAENEPGAHGFGPTKMLNSDGFRCCLGHIAKQCGFTDDQLCNRDTPVDVVRAVGSEPAGFLVERDEYGSGDTDLTNSAIGINDSDELGLAEREDDLRTLFRKHGYRLRFVGSYSSFAQTQHGKEPGNDG